MRFVSTSGAVCVVESGTSKLGSVLELGVEEFVAFRATGARRGTELEPNDSEEDTDVVFNGEVGERVFVALLWNEYSISGLLIGKNKRKK